MALQIVERQQWYARMAGYVPALPGPAGIVMCNYNRKEYLRGKPSPGPRPTSNDVIDELMYLQRGDLNKYPDIRYNFMVGADGNVYEGRGWISVPALPLKWNKFNFQTLYIGYIGDFADEPPPDIMFEKRDELLRFGVQNKFIEQKFLLITLPVSERYKLPFTAYVR